MGYKVHHLNCGTLCMRGARLLQGSGGLFDQAHLSCHCLLIETNEGLVLVDTGFGYKDIFEPTFPDTQLTKRLMGVKITPEECAVSQIRQLGFSPAEVRHIVMTHLDLDHAGGLMDFPAAQVHVLGKELDAAQNPTTLWEKTRYRPYLWQHAPYWNTHAPVGERWFGFDAVQVLAKPLSDILLIPLTGHSRGHCGVAVATEHDWLLHCGDAYFHHAEISPDPQQKAPIGLSLIQAMDDVCRAERLANQLRLRELARTQGQQIRMICSHDHSEFDRCQRAT